jgi:ferric-dicitrate binding protein FerR (iron transport regulator)
MNKEDLNPLQGIDAKTLLQRYANGTASAQERLLYEEWYSQLHSENHAQLSEQELALAEQQLLHSLQQQIQPAPVKRIRWRRWTVAASLLLLATATALFLSRNMAHKETGQQAGLTAIQPGKNNATLTLPNGQQIQLSDAQSGVVINTNSLAYTDGTALEAGLSNTGISGNPVLTARTPRGGTYQFTLNDGTKVWLNADSKLQFTAVFTGSERKVSLAGEAFFEVAKDAKRPFIVESNGQELKVLGTSFNMNAYGDEPFITTTLVEGSVQVKASGDGSPVVLQQGQQSLVAGGNVRARQADAADIEQAVAWKNGDFIFDADIQTIMKQVARWYDVEVSYKGVIPTEEFVGKIARSKSITQVLKILESTNSVHFEIKERRITVMK